MLMVARVRRLIVAGKSLVRDCFLPIVPYRIRLRNIHSRREEKRMGRSARSWRSITFGRVMGNCC